MPSWQKESGPELDPGLSLSPLCTVPGQVDRGPLAGGGGILSLRLSLFLLQDISGQLRVTLFERILGKLEQPSIACAKTVLFIYLAPPTCQALLLELRTILRSRYLYFHLMDTEAEAQGSWETCPRFKYLAEPEWQTWEAPNPAPAPARPLCFGGWIHVCTHTAQMASECTRPPCSEQTTDVSHRSPHQDSA